MADIKELLEAKKKERIDAYTKKVSTQIEQMKISLTKQLEDHQVGDACCASQVYLRITSWIGYEREAREKILTWMADSGFKEIEGLNTKGEKVFCCAI